MRIEIVRERELIEEATYSLCFDFNDSEGAGYAFPCKENGHVLLDQMTREGLRNFALCLNAQNEEAWEKHDVGAPYVRKYEQRYIRPAAGPCVRCGREVELSGFTNTCECGADYNIQGDLLAPREQWGEETGETWVDILGPGEGR